ncbi:restriction endonuclease subunit S [Enterobacter hormaechei]|uniref:restriction endonuclease subunit S n=1 Tax=Enterobacter hormaechei TaxID=158836 RepID=UPI003AFAEC14
MVDLMVNEQQSGAVGKDVPVGFKLTEVGVIPEDWDVARLGDVCDLINGRGFKPYEWGFEGLPIIRIQNLNGSDEFNYYNGNYDPKIFIKHGQLLFAWSGSRGSSFGPHIWSGNDALLNYHTWKLLIKTPSLEEGYFYYILKNLTSKIEERAHGASALVHTQKGEMEQFLIPLPLNKDEQIKISKSLSSIDALIIKLEKLLIKKQSIKTATMQQLLTGKTRLPQFALREDGVAKGYKKSELGEIPEDWTVTLLNDVIDSCSSGATPYRGVTEYYKGNNRWITSGELNYCVINDTIEKISDSAIKDTNLKIHPAGTFLMAITGLEAAGTRGACGIVGRPSATNQSCMAIYPNNKLDCNYLYHWYVYNGDTLAFKYCQGTKQLSYTAGLIRKIPLFLPTDKKEQAAIATILSDMDNDIQTLQQRLGKTHQLKQGMMQELLTGKTRLI